MTEHAIQVDGQDFTVQLFPPDAEGHRIARIVNFNNQDSHLLGCDTDEQALSMMAKSIETTIWLASQGKADA